MRYPARAKANYRGVPDDPSKEKALREELEAGIRAALPYDSLSEPCRGMFSLRTFQRLRYKLLESLTIGQRVVWIPDGMVGTVRDKDYAAVKIEWADGKWALLPFQGNAPWQNVQVLQ